MLRRFTSVTFCFRLKSFQSCLLWKPFKFKQILAGRSSSGCQRTGECTSPSSVWVSWSPAKISSQATKLMSWSRMDLSVLTQLWLMRIRFLQCFRRKKVFIIILLIWLIAISLGDYLMTLIILIFSSFSRNFHSTARRRRSCASGPHWHQLWYIFREDFDEEPALSWKCKIFF